MKTDPDNLASDLTKAVYQLDSNIRTGDFFVGVAAPPGERGKLIIHITNKKAFKNCKEKLPLSFGDMPVETLIIGKIIAGPAFLANDTE